MNREQQQPDYYPSWKRVQEKLVMQKKRREWMRCISLVLVFSSVIFIGYLLRNPTMSHAVDPMKKMVKNIEAKFVPH